MAKDDISRKAAELLSPYLEENDLEIFRTEYKKEGPGWVLRVVLDKPADSDEEYVSIEECEGAAKYLSDRLDENDMIDRSYNLEVCSPGLDRELIRETDYIKFSGRQIEVRTYEQICGSKFHEGILRGKEDGEVIIDTDSGELRISSEKISKINLAVVF